MNLFVTVREPKEKPNKKARGNLDRIVVPFKQAGVGPGAHALAPEIHCFLQNVATLKTSLAVNEPVCKAIRSGINA